jgi:hypothetical protein
MEKLANEQHLFGENPLQSRSKNARILKNIFRTKPVQLVYCAVGV